MKTTLDPQSKAFAARVDKLTLQLLREDVVDFGELLKRLPGVYPSEALESVRRHASAGLVFNSILNTVTNPPSLEQEDLLESRPVVTHPLDYYWRFTSETVKSLVDRAVALTSNGETLIFMGTPSVLEYNEKRIIDRRLVLLDNNLEELRFVHRISNITALKVNLLTDDLPSISTSLVVVDPPWYVEHQKAFLWHAARCCIPKGHVLMSAPPIGTRPKIGEERKEMIDFAWKLGLEVVSIVEGALKYQTPFFEQNSLRALGIYNIPRGWRSGDLIVFKSIIPVSAPRPMCGIQEEWIEEEIDNVKIRVRNPSPAEFIDPRLVSVVENDILTAVSRRDNRRSLADVWTSGNRIFQCKGRYALRVILKGLADNQSPSSNLPREMTNNLRPSELQLIEETAQQVRRLVAMENHEWKEYRHDA
jgi:hypothetical protein